jgi:hypothetical protein
LRFHLEEIDGAPEAVFDDATQVEKTLLSRFLHHAPHFVPDVLYEISLVERKAVESSGFETALVDVQFSSDGVMITSRFKGIEETGPAQIVLSVDEAKLLLLEWGAEVLRWRLSKNFG